MINPEDTLTEYSPVHQDRRELPRILVRGAGLVVTLDGARVPVKIRDVSPDGVQFRCNLKAAGIIHPRGTAIRKGQASGVVRVALRLPIKKEVAMLTVVGRLIYFAVIAPDVATIGIQYTQLSERDQATLDRFLMCELEPRDLPQYEAEKERLALARKVRSRGDRLVIQPKHRL